jgi:hypothetical protein
VQSPAGSPHFIEKNRLKTCRNGQGEETAAISRVDQVRRINSYRPMRLEIFLDLAAHTAVAVLTRILIGPCRLDLIAGSVGLQSKLECEETRPAMMKMELALFKEKKPAVVHAPWYQAKRG